MEFTIGVGIGILSTLLRAWLAMLLIGWLHSEWSTVPPLGYGATILITMILGIMTYRDEGLE